MSRGISTAIQIDWKRFGDAVRLARTDKTRGLTQKEVADALNCSQPLIARIEKGDRVTERNAQRVANFLKIKLSDYRRSASARLISPATREAKVAFCAYTACPGRNFAVVGGQVYAIPEFQLRSKLVSENCRFCGLPLETSCPESTCGLPVTQGALCCQKCNEPLILLPEEMLNATPDQVERECRRRNRMSELIRRRLGQS